MNLFEWTNFVNEDLLVYCMVYIFLYTKYECYTVIRHINTICLQIK